MDEENKTEGQSAREHLESAREHLEKAKIHATEAGTEAKAAASAKVDELRRAAGEKMEAECTLDRIALADARPAVRLRSTASQINACP